MGLRNLQLSFDGPQQAYIGGQTISGRLLVDTGSPKKLRSIVIKFKGEADVHWTESRTVRRNGKSERKTTHYRGHEQYFENRIKVFGGEGESTLPPGEHYFQFSMILPLNLPSSFEGDHGYIRYTVKATLDRPWKFDHEAKAAFTVISHLDLNSDPKYKNPVKVENHKHFCCLCCKSGPLTLATHIPATGYVPGQKIPLTVEIDNASDVVVSQIVCELQKYVIYHATSPGKSKKTKVDVSNMVLDGSVRENNSRTWAEKFNIPPLPPSILRECNLIDLEYKLKVKAKPEGMHMQLENKLPITIGTIPLWGIADNYSVPSPSSLVPTAPPIEMGPTAPYPDMPPPTYEECVFGTTDIGDSEDNSYIQGTKGYNPRYPTYDLPPSYPGIGWAAPT